MKAFGFHHLSLRAGVIALGTPKCNARSASFIYSVSSVYSFACMHVGPRYRSTRNAIDSHESCQPVFAYTIRRKITPPLIRHV
ncbi:hypothetical protein PLICRDRAFT_34280 [Plicaturopsis crispa FD-325 SS-3]|nr:hypothetical protein PLICRDRAFT_34280 [Plicaturopsis crispa FD-325 SS-3]